MLEQDIIKALLDKDTYSNYRKKVPTISDGMKPWFDTLDAWFENKESSLKPAELHALHIARHPAITNSARQLIDTTFDLIKGSEANPEVIVSLIETKYNQDQYNTFAEKFIKLAEGNITYTLSDIERELKEFNIGKAKEQEFAPFVITPEQMLDACEAQGKWKFNLPIWREHVGGIGPGVFGLFAARPNAGKTLAGIHSSFGPGGWAEQGAKIFWHGNEEGIHRTKHRAICCWAGIDFKDSRAVKRKEFLEAAHEFEKKFIIPEQVIFYHRTGMDYMKVEDIIKEHTPDIYMADQLDKIHVPGDQEGHVRLRKLYTTMRENTANYPVAIMGVSQASDEASGKKWFGFEALEGSKTGKGAELDLCICIGAENLQQDSGARYFYVAKNKLTGWEQTGSYMINKEQSRMLG